MADHRDAQENDFESELSAYLDGELESEREAALRAALARDPQLARRLEQLRHVDTELRTLAQREVPSGLATQLRERIESSASAPATAERVAPSRRSRWLVPVLAAAAAAALFVLPRLRAPRPAEAPPLGGEALAALPSPEELALVLELDDGTDLEVIEVLDLLESLGELESGGRG